MLCLDAPAPALPIIVSTVIAKNQGKVGHSQPNPHSKWIEPKVCAASITSTELTSTIDMSQYSQIRQEQMQDSDLKPVLEWKDQTKNQSGQWYPPAPQQQNTIGHNGRAWN